MRFGHDNRVAALSYRSWALWFLGYPDAALADAENALKDARQIDQAATLMYALAHVFFPNMFCGDYVRTNTLVEEITTLAAQKATSQWQAFGMMNRGCLLALTGKASEAATILTSAIPAMRITGATVWMPLYLSYLALAYAKLGQFEDSRRLLGEATATLDSTKEKWHEAEVHRIAGEIALKSPEQDISKAQSSFERSLAVARQQQAKSWELRAAMSMARLWRDRGKRDEARELLAPVYGWFTEGFDTRDLKEAKALLDELSS
jgi:predicted ATPase